MKRRVLDLTQLDSLSIFEWMHAQPTTHVRFQGVVMTREQFVEYARLGETKGAEAQERFLAELRNAA
jgi:hypothetical protein